MPKPTLAERLWRKSERSPDGCLVWTAYRDRRGYGKIAYNGGPVLVHRFAYELLVGPIPEGLELDHLCRNPSCWNPAHLEPVDHRTNVLRGVGPVVENARKTHCKHGHEFTPDNTVPQKGGRDCRECRRLRATKRRQTMRWTQ